MMPIQGGIKYFYLNKIFGSFLVQFSTKPWQAAVGFLTPRNEDVKVSTCLLAQLYMEMDYVGL